MLVPNKKVKIVVAMSGGVDSSVAAALLKRAGFNVVGIFMNLLGNNSREAAQRAKKVAQTLKIPFRVLDLQKQFKRKVIECFLKEYRLGATPNPCVICNKEVKFGLLLEKASILGADFIATGHYIRRKGQKLLRGKDPAKDQSYFLWKLSKDQVGHILFPVGGHTKKEVRVMAKKMKLPTADTPGSQEICFVPQTINEFLRKYFKPKKGKIVNETGKVLGEHQGLVFYTIGQRKGIGLAGGPYFVLNKDRKRNTLIVTNDGKTLLQKTVVFQEQNWLSGKRPKLGQRLEAKIRSRHQGAAGALKKADTFVFDKPQRAITPGQSIVFYRRQELLGGGIIR